MAREEKEGFCTLCRSRCGTINVVENGRLVQVLNNPSHPTGKATCAKGRAGPEIAHSARRLTTPLRRTRPKGADDPGFVPISWDEALEEIAVRLGSIRDQSGAESVVFAVTSGSSSSASDSLDWIQRLVRLFGSPNIISATEICNWHKDYAHAFTFGCGIPTADYRNSDLIILWGHNPSNVWLAQSEAIGTARSQGAKLAVVDPRRTSLARDAELWLGVRPGTDGALAMGLSRRLIATRGYDEQFVRRYTNACFLVRGDNGHFLRGRDTGGTYDPDAYLVFDVGGAGVTSVAQHSNPAVQLLDGSIVVQTRDGDVECKTAFRHFREATEPFDVLRVAEITGIEAEKIEALAEAIAEANSVSYHCWTGVGQHVNATQTERAIATLYALTGSFDKPGGNVRHASHNVPKLQSIDMLAPAQRRKALGLESRPLGPPLHGLITGSDFYTAVLERKPYAVRALFSFGSNLLISQPGRERGRAALSALDFQVHCDLFMNPTAEFADIVLPVSSPWENEALRIGFEISHEAQEHVQLRQRIVPRVGGSRSDTEIVFDLAKRLGLGDSFFGGNVEAGYDYLLKPLNLTVENLRSRPGGVRGPLQRQHQRHVGSGFPTETGRAELYSELLLRHEYPAVPKYVPPFESEDAEFPLTLCSVNNGYFCHSQHRGTNALRRRRPDPLASIHPSTAHQAGISDNDWIAIRTRDGEVRVRAKLDDGIREDTVASDYGWWQAAPDLGLGAGGSIEFEGRNATYNEIISDRARDPISGALPLRSSRCRIERLPSATWMGSRPFVVVSKTQLSDEVTAVSFAPADGGALPSHRPGQFVGIHIEGHRRSYSLTDPATGDMRSYGIAVRRIGEGAVSTAIADRLKVGDVVGLDAPAGNFIIPPENEFPIVMIAGGVGITPFMSYVRSLQTGRKAPPRIVLHYGCRDLRNIPFAEELAALAAVHPNFKVHLHLSGTRPANRGYLAGRFSVDQIDQSLIKARARFYICASERMIQDTRHSLIDLGVPIFEIFSELFRSPNRAYSADLAPKDVIFVRSQRTLRWTPEAGSILNLAESAGLRIPSGCRVGQCESCAVKLLEGSVVHASANEHLEDDQCLTCQARPVTDILIDA